VKAPLAHESARDQPPPRARKTNARRTAPVEEPEEEEVPESRRRRILRIADVNSVPVLTILSRSHRGRGVPLGPADLSPARPLVAGPGRRLRHVDPQSGRRLAAALGREASRGSGAIVTFVALLIFLGLAVLFGYPLINGIHAFRDGASALRQPSQHGQGWIGHLFRKYHVESWVKAQLESPHLDSRPVWASRHSRSARVRFRRSCHSCSSSRSSFVADRSTQIRRSLTKIGGPRTSQAFSPHSGASSRARCRLHPGDMLTSLAAGLVVFVTLLIVGVPYAFFCGRCGSRWLNFLPTIGGALAGVPTVLFAFRHSLTAVSSR